MLGLLCATLFGALSALWRRVAHGPTLPSWGLRFEVAVAALRSSLTHLAKLDPDRARSLPQPKARPSKAVRSLRIEPVRANVDGRSFSVPQVRGTWVKPQREASGTLLFLHGGGYISCSPDTHLELVGQLVLAGGFNAFSLDYRLAPEHPHPAAVDDALAVVRWLQQQGVGANQLVIAGDSAGGGLTTALLMSLRDQEQDLPLAAGLISPWIDLADSSPSLSENETTDYLTRSFLDQAARAYADAMPLTTPLISPLHGDLTRLPPLMVQVGDAEILRDQGLAFANQASRAGVDVTLSLYPEMPHDWHVFGSLQPSSQVAIRELATYLRAALDRKARP